jgi:hypothetical protein
VNHQLPRLAETVQWMTAAQRRFGFELVDISAPLGTWRLERRDHEENRGTLRADQVAEKLKNKPRELGVDYLFCVTGFQLGDARYDDLYGWEGDAGRPLALFSTAGLGLEDAPPDAVERGVVNAAVSALSTLRTGLEAHKRGPRMCPLYFNPGRDLEQITGRQRFDARCRAEIRRRGGKDDLAALEALLAGIDGAA